MANLKPQPSVGQAPRLEHLPNIINDNLEEEEEKESDPDWRPGNSAKSKVSGPVPGPYRRRFPHWCGPCQISIRDRRDLERHFGTRKHLINEKDREDQKENLVDDLKCLPCDVVFISLPILMQHLESPFHKMKVATLEALQENKSANGDENFQATEVTEYVEALEPMDTSDSSVVVQIESSIPLINDTPVLEEITHLNNIPLEDIMIMQDS